MTLNRRTLLKGLGGGLAASQLSFLPHIAQASTTNTYQALVCIFLYGGNDGNNTIIPIDPTNYALYQQWRGSLALKGSTAPIPLGSTNFGIHPSMPNCAQLFDNGDLGLVLNVGTLIDQRLTVPLYQANPVAADVPDNLFSHEDQRNEWKSAVYKGSTSTGWGGRIADTLPLSGGGNVAPLMSFAGPDLWTLASTNAPLCLPATGSFVLNPYLGKPYASLVASAVSAASNATQTPYGNDAISAVQTITAAGVGASTLLNPVLTGKNATIDGYFKTVTGSTIGQQLWSVAKIIADQSTLGAQTQVFYVDLGNFDTHTNQLAIQETLLKELDQAVFAFYSATAALGLAQNVTTFTLSDFARTYVPNTTGGTDHAWGNHMLVVGGSVKPQSVVGSLPPLNAFSKGSPVGPLDIETEGRWLPQISVDQYAATLASWLGVSSANLQKIFPTLANFSPQNLGFLNPAP
jgi:uncharacterized protein (DUF1501 family)